MDFVGFSGGIKFFERAGCMLPGSLCGQGRCQCHYHSTMLRRRILNHRVTRGNLYLYLTRSHSICNKNIRKIEGILFYNVYDPKVSSFYQDRCAILISFKIVVVFNTTSVNIKTKSADIVLKTTTTLKEMRISQLSS